MVIIVAVNSIAGVQSVVWSHEVRTKAKAKPMAVSIEW